MRKGEHHTEEAKKKISESLKGIRAGENHHMYGKHHSEETRKKMSENHADVSDENNPMYGKHRTEETKNKISEANKGRHLTEETKRKMSKAHKDRPRSSPTKGKHMSKEIKQKISNTLKGRPSPNKGKTFSKEWRKHISEANCGENNGRWLGGISFEPYCPKFNKEFKERVRAFFEYKCLICGKSEEELGKKCSVHHVDYDKKVCCNDTPPMFAAVCIRHNMVANGNRERWQYMFHYIIDEIYDGKCYYTKEEYVEVVKHGGNTKNSKS